MESLVTQALKVVVTDLKCSLCDVSFQNGLNESTKLSHCSSKRHLNNIKIYLEQIKTNLESLQTVQVPKVSISPLVPSFKCQICNISIASEEKLAKHWSANHNRIYPFYCPTCNVSTNSAESMFEHFKSAKHQAKQGPYTPFFQNLPVEVKNLMLIGYCSVCNKAFPEPSLENAIQHYNTDQHQSAVRYLLKQKQLANIEQKASVAKGPSLQLFENSDLQTFIFCFICKKDVLKAEKLSHMQSFPHKELTEIKLGLVKDGIADEFWDKHEVGLLCKLCQVRLPGPSQFAEHFKALQHQKKIQNWRDGAPARQPGFREHTKWYYCQICDKDLDGTLDVTKHYTGISHQKYASWYCEICEKSFGSDILLKQHKESKHFQQHTALASTTTTFTMAQKNKNLPSNAVTSVSLDQASLPSKGQQLCKKTGIISEKNFYCDICEKGFVLEASLKNHNEAKHYQQPGALESTNTTFSMSEKNSYLSSNAVTSVSLDQASSPSKGQQLCKKTGIISEKNFYCDICEKGFVLEASLKNHNKAKHYQQPGALESTNTTFSMSEKNSYLSSNAVTSVSLDQASSPSKGQQLCKKTGIISEKNFYCDICEKGFVLEASLKNHNEAKHYQQLGPLPSALEITNTTFSLSDINSHSSSNFVTSESLGKSSLGSENLELCKNPTNSVDFRNSSEQRNPEPDSENKNLKEQVFNQLQKLVQKLYYSKTVPYKYGLDYLKKINREIEQLSKKFTNPTAEADIAESVVLTTKNCHEAAEKVPHKLIVRAKTTDARPLTSVVKEHSELTINYLKDSDAPMEEVLAPSVLIDIENNSRKLFPNICNVSSVKTPSELSSNVTDILSKPTNFEKKSENISDLLAEILDRKQVVEVELKHQNEPERCMEKDVLTEIEILLRKIERVDAPLDETLWCLERYNDQLDNEDFIQNSNILFKEQFQNGTIGQTDLKDLSETCSDSDKKNDNIELQRNELNDTEVFLKSQNINQRQIKTNLLALSGSTSSDDLASDTSFEYVSAEEENDKQFLGKKVDIDEVIEKNDENIIKYSYTAEELTRLRFSSKVDHHLKTEIDKCKLWHTNSIGSSTDFQKSIYSYYSGNNFNLFMNFLDVYLQV